VICTSLWAERGLISINLTVGVDSVGHTMRLDTHSPPDDGGNGRIVLTDGMQTGKQHVPLACYLKRSPS
jgi:hypothetical protein